MDNVFKLKARKDFYDLQGKRKIPQGVMFYESDKDRALKFVSTEVADIVERPKEVVAAPVQPVVETNVDEVEKPKPVVKPVVVKKPVVKKPAPKKVVKK